MGLVAVEVMKRILFIAVLFFQLCLIKADPQENAAAPPRTPEQEAALQTNKMRQELGLTDEQSREVFEINLRHARERQTSTSRSEALKRVKYKEQELQRVLSPRQYDRLQEMRYDHPAATAIDASVNGRTRPVTNPQRIEGGRAVPAREGVQPGSANRRSSYSQPSDGRNVPSYQRGREVSPAGNSTNSRRSVPEGTRYVPQTQERSSGSRSENYSTHPVSPASRPESSRPGSGSSSSGNSGSSSRSSGSSSSGSTRR